MNDSLPSAIAPESNAVVHAAAGTGKTWLLTSRIVRLLLQGAQPGGILAITFTRKAAQEMTERVHQRLLRMASAPPPRLSELIKELGLSPTTANLDAARGLYERLLASEHALRTTTFHAFCQELLRRFPLEAGIAPGFELIEDTTALRNAAWRAFTRELTTQPSAQTARAMDTLFAQCNGLESTRSALYSFLLHRSDWWAYTENAEDSVATALERLDRSLGAGGGDPREKLRDDTEFARLCEHFVAAIGDDPIPSLRDRADVIKETLSGCLPPDELFNRLWAAFFTQKGERRRVAKQQGERSVGDGHTLMQVHTRICDFISTIQETLLAQASRTANAAWYRCGARLLDHYQRIKEARHQLDFADLEWHAYRLLTRSEHAEWVQYKLDQHIDHLLIDEFQDTNPTQWRLVLPLLQELAAGSPERPRSVFLVGDEKQSIYRFRRAEPRLFRQAHAWLLEHTGAAAYTQDISWRASPAVTEFVNTLFRDGSDFVLPEFRKHFAHYTERPGRVHVQSLFYRARDRASQPRPGRFLRNPLTTPRDNAEDLRHYEEGTWIADQIAELLNSGLAIDAGSGDDNVTLRRLTYSDIFILLRDRTHAQSYEDALRDAGIPFVGTSRRQFQDALEVRDLTNLLRVLIAPHDNLALAGVLRSPVFDFTDVDLITLAGMRDVPLWWDRLARQAARGAATQVAERAWRLLSRWRSLADRVPVHDLLDRIFSEGSIMARYASAAPTQLRTRVEANLVRFMGLALDQDSGRYPSLSRFLTEITAERPDGESVGADSAIIGTDGCVRILTIHAAKGLEAPVVFIGDSARAGTERPRVPWTLVDWPVDAPRPARLLLGGRQERLDALTREVFTQERAAALREEANLLYVAVTRAKQVLYISGCAPARGESLGWYGFIVDRLRDMSAVDRSDGISIEFDEMTADDGTNRINATIEFKYFRHLAIEEPGAEQPIDVDARLYTPIAVDSGVTRRRPSDMMEGDADIESPLSWRTARMRGIVLHRALDLITGRPSINHSWQRFEREYDRTAPGAWLRECWDEALAVVREPRLQEFFDPMYFREARNELPLLYRQGDEQVLGYVDRVLVTDDSVTIIDYKSNPLTSTADLDAFVVRYTPQMARYARGLASVWPDRRLRAVLIFTRTRHAVDIPLSV